MHISLAGKTAIDFRGKLLAMTSEKYSVTIFLQVFLKFYKIENKQLNGASQYINSLFKCELINVHCCKLAILIASDLVLKIAPFYWFLYCTKLLGVGPLEIFCFALQVYSIIWPCEQVPSTWSKVGREWASTASQVRSR